MKTKTKSKKMFYVGSRFNADHKFYKPKKTASSRGLTGRRGAKY